MIEATSTGRQPWAAKNPGPSAGPNFKGAPAASSSPFVFFWSMRRSPGETRSRTQWRKAAGLVRSPASMATSSAVR